MDGGDAFLVGAMGATVHISTSFDTVPDDFAATMLAFGSHRVNRALETIEVMRYPVNHNFQRLVISIAANLAGVHIVPSF